MFDKRMNPTRAVMLGICGLAVAGVLAVGIGGGPADVEDAQRGVELADEAPVSMPSVAPAGEAAVAFDEMEEESNVDGFDPAAQDPQADAMAAEPVDSAPMDTAPIDVAPADPAPARPDKSAEE